MQAPDNATADQRQILEAMGIDVWVRRNIQGQSSSEIESVQPAKTRRRPVAGIPPPSQPQARETSASAAIVLETWRRGDVAATFCRQHQQLLQDILSSMPEINLLVIGCAGQGEQDKSGANDIQPRSGMGILLVGERAGHAFLPDNGIGESLHGRLHRHPHSKLPCLVVPELESLSRRPGLKRQLWRDLQLFLAD